MKPSKKLMRDFAKVVGCNPIPLNESSPRLWQTVIELAQKWCSENSASMSCCWNEGIGWDFGIHLKNKDGDGLSKSLPIAIMKAVVEASK